MSFSDNRAFMYMVLGAVAISFSPIFVVMSEVGPAASGFWRIALALPFFWWGLHQDKVKNGYKGRHGNKKAPTTRGDYLFLAFGGVFFGVELGLWHLSLQYTTVANATVFSNMNPIVVALLSVWLFGEVLTRQFFLGMFVAILGAVVLSGASFLDGGERVFGDMLSLLTAVVYGAYLMTVSRLALKFSTPVIMFWNALWAMPVLWLWSFFTGEVIIPSSLYGWSSMFGLAFICQVLGQSLITEAFSKLPAAFGSVTLLIQSVLAAALAWVLFEEAVGPVDGVGIVIILVGIVIARLGALKPTKKTEN
jgi:drug/metabolite transporter (DMT)-like permease